jgi:hypothetical protein
VDIKRIDAERELEMIELQMGLRDSIEAGEPAGEATAEQPAEAQSEEPAEATAEEPGESEEERRG